MRKHVFTIATAIILLFVTGLNTYAQSVEVLEGIIQKVLTSEIETIDGKEYRNQRLDIYVTKGSLSEQNIIVESGALPTLSQRAYEEGDKVIISATLTDNGPPIFTITDFIRTTPLLFITSIFVLLSIIIGRKKGLASLMGLGISFIIIAYFILPQITQGRDPVVIAVVSALGIMVTTFYLSHGFNQVTTTAIAGTSIAISITAVLGTIFVDAANLTGFSSDEAIFLDISTGGTLNMHGLVLAGIIIGTLGILDDITISQAAIVAELKQTDERLTHAELFSKAMNIGRDHIASLVNTLILVYTGSALPLMLLFIEGSQTFTQTLNTEIIAEEIIRTLVGSIGLIIAVPITTLIATYSLKRTTHKHTRHTHVH